MMIAFTPTDQPQRVPRPDAPELLVLLVLLVLLEVVTDICFNRLYARGVSF
jgi:hypothetical protein